MNPYMMALMHKQQQGGRRNPPGAPPAERWQDFIHADEDPDPFEERENPAVCIVCSGPPAGTCDSCGNCCCVGCACVADQRTGELICNPCGGGPARRNPARRPTSSGYRTRGRLLRCCVCRKEKVHPSYDFRCISCRGYVCARCPTGSRRCAICLYRRAR